MGDLSLRHVGSSLWHAGFSSFDAWAPEHAGSVVTAHRLSSCGAWAPEHTGSVVVAHGLSCPTACGILVPRQGIEPASPALEGRFLTTGPPGKSPQIFCTASSFQQLKTLKQKDSNAWEMKICLGDTIMGVFSFIKFQFDVGKIINISY